MTTVITLTDHSLHFRLSVTPKTVCVCVGGAGVTCCSDQHQLLEEPSKIFAVNVVMREGEHKAEKGSSENGVNGPEVTQLEVGKLGWSPVAGLLAGSPDQSRTQPPPASGVGPAQSGGVRTEWWGPHRVRARGTGGPCSERGQPPDAACVELCRQPRWARGCCRWGYPSPACVNQAAGRKNRKKATQPAVQTAAHAH